MKQSIIIIAEHTAGRINPVTDELISFAKKMQELRPLSIKVIMLGTEILKPATEIAESSGLDVMGFEIPRLPDYNGELYGRVLTEQLIDARPVYVCVAHTSRGLDFAPALAVEMEAACITGVEDVVQSDDHICFVRPLFGGKAMAHIHPDAETTVLTLQPGLFERKQRGTASKGRVAVDSIAITPEWWHSQGVKQSGTDTAGVSEAEVIVAAGQGFGERDNLELAHQLAAIFSKSAVAGSRIVCDLGWLEYGCQVGVTGATVSPRLYIACGISGAIQHVSGMRGSDLIVAINKDPAAAIFQSADICIVEDVLTFIPTFIEMYQNLNDQIQ